MIISLVIVYILGILGIWIHTGYNPKWYGDTMGLDMVKAFAPFWPLLIPTAIFWGVVIYPIWKLYKLCQYIGKKLR